MTSNQKMQQNKLIQNLMNVKKVSQVIKTCSKLAILGSFTIWNARYLADWNGGDYLAP